MRLNTTITEGNSLCDHRQGFMDEKKGWHILTEDLSTRSSWNRNQSIWWRETRCSGIGGRSRERWGEDDSTVYWFIWEKPGKSTIYCVFALDIGFPLRYSCFRNWGVVSEEGQEMKNSSEEEMQPAVCGDEDSGVYQRRMVSLPAKVYIQCSRESVGTEW